MTIISGEAGIGKTELLDYLAYKIKEGDSNRWVVKLDLNKYTKQFSDNIDSFKEKKKVTAAKVKKFLSIDLLNHKSLEDLLFRQKFDQKDISILIDSFDSVADYEPYRDMIFKIN